MPRGSGPEHGLNGAPSDPVRLRPARERAERLRAQRIRAGYRSPTAFAQEHNFNPTTYYHHEVGRRAFSPEMAKAYAEALNIDPSLILYGTELPGLAKIPIVGQVVRNGVIQPMPESATDLHVEVDLRELTSYEIVGDWAYPFYAHGDRLLSRPLSREHLDPALIDGLECLIEPEHGGDLLIGRVIIQHDGTANIHPPNARPLRNVVLHAAEPILHIIRYIPGLSHPF
jgi:hypothetical protein